MDGILDILNKSNRRVVKLNLLSKFFKNSSLASICIKTQVIHTFFKNNHDLDFNKLELFHLQYTDSLLDLLNKIKKHKEVLIVNCLNEISANNDYIKLNFSQDNIDDYETERRLHSGEFSAFLKLYYKNLVGENNVLNYNEISLFSNKWISHYFRIESLFDAENIKYYETENILVQTKLLGKLNINLFKARFLYGFIYNHQIVEMFQIFQTEDKFIWDVVNKKIVLINEKQFETILDLKTKNSSITIQSNLELKNLELKNKINSIKNTIPLEVLELLQSYEDNLEQIEFLNKSLSFSEESNVLKSMLNLRINNT